MEENGKRRLAIALVALAGIAYFFVCARPLPKELVLCPNWSRLLPRGENAATRAESASPLLHYQFKDSFGYFGEDGSSLSTIPLPVASGAAVSDLSYISFDGASMSLSRRSPDGRELSRISESGYPFFGGGRLFLIRPGQSLRLRNRS